MGSCAYIVNIGGNVFSLINWLKEYRIFVEFRILFIRHAQSHLGNHRNPVFPFSSLLVIVFYLFYISRCEVCLLTISFFDSELMLIVYIKGKLPNVTFHKGAVVQGYFCILSLCHSTQYKGK